MELMDQLNLLRQEKKWAELETLARDCLAQNPKFRFGLHALEQSIREQNRPEELPPIWRTLVHDHGEVYPFAANLGLAIHENDPSEAIPLLRTGLRAATDAKDTDLIEATWLALADLNPRDTAFFLEIAENVATRKERKFAADLLQTLIEPVEATGDHRKLLELLRKVSDLAPRNDDIRKEAERIYRKIYAGRPDLSLLIDRSGLGGSTPVPEAIAHLERYLPFGMGRLVHHDAWGVGEVKRLDPLTRTILIDFAKKPAHTMSLELAEKNLVPLDDEDLRALLAKQPEKVREMKESDPVRLVHCAIRSLGGKAGGRELKDRLTEQVVSQEEWSAFWSAVSKKLKVDPRVQVSGGGAKVFELREEAITYDDEIRARFDRERGIPGAVKVLDEYLSHAKTETPSMELIQHMTHGIATKAAREKSKPLKVEAVFRLDEMRQVYPDLKTGDALDLSNLLRNRTSALEIMNELRLDRHQWRWAEDIRRAHESDWLSIYAEILLLPNVLVRDFIADNLLGTEGGEKVFRETFEKTSAATREFPAAFIWFCDRGIRVPRDAGRLGRTPAFLFERMMRLLDHLGAVGRRLKGADGLELREYAGRIRAIVRKDNFSIIRRVLENADLTVAESVRNSLASNAGFDLNTRGEILRHLYKAFPDVGTPVQDRKSQEEAAETDAGFFCTQEALDARKREIKTIKEIDIPQNARDIEEARSRGDLRENAEYKYAKERQTFLHSRMRELTEMLGKARVVNPSEVRTDRVVFGTQVTLRDLVTGLSLDYTLLGPWESDPERGIISHLSELGKSILGKQVGEEAIVRNGAEEKRLEVVKIEKAAMTAIPDKPETSPV